MVFVDFYKGDCVRPTLIDHGFHISAVCIIPTSSSTKRWTIHGCRPFSSNSRLNSFPLRKRVFTNALKEKF